MSKVNVGIHGIACSFPESRRTNDWWPEEAVESWRARRASAPAIDTSTFTNGMKMALSAIIETQDDPFLGAKLRYVANPGDSSSDYELKAAVTAIERSGIDRSKIDLLLSNSNIQNDLNAPNACLLHKLLGLSKKCFTTSTQAACNAFLLQMNIAHQMIASGQAHYALLVNSCVMSPLLDPNMSLSCIFGDGAAAAVIGPVGEGRGVRGHSTHTDGDFYDVIKIGIPQRKWWEPYRSVLHTVDGPAGFRMLLELGDSAKEVLHEALAAAGCQPTDVNFYAAHQGTVWFRKVSQEVAGMTNAKSVDTFADYGNISSVNIPLALELGEKAGLLKEDDLVAMHSGGSGITLTGMVMRWGS